MIEKIQIFKTIFFIFFEINSISRCSIQQVNSSKITSEPFQIYVFTLKLVGDHMKIRFKKTLAAIGTLSILGGGIALLPFGNESSACGYNSAGGEGYSPQQKGSGYFQKSAITQDKAVEIVTRHIQRLNPDLKIGNINDAGPMYEAEILSGVDKEILQVIGVYKQSGQMVIIN